ncbi:MAG: hypothetical protein JST78_09555 [Bacteroidetes bacterium]|nr:hypothetical protein [Bacteroidota bacterium]
MNTSEQQQKSNYPSQASQEQIEAWKKEHDEFFAVTCDDKIAYFKKPDRKILSYAGLAGQKDPMKYNETIIQQCFIGGDEIFKTDDKYFLSACLHIEEISKIKVSQLEKF